MSPDKEREEILNRILLAIETGNIPLVVDLAFVSQGTLMMLVEIARVRRESKIALR